MPFRIDIEAQSGTAAGLQQLAREAAAQALQLQQAPPNSALTVLLADDETLSDLHRQFMGEPDPTDVLSFPAGDLPPDIEELAGYLGDIAISVDTARRQAESKKHDVAAEVQLLVVHGVLHLLGHDHLDGGERDRMWSAQRAILQELGLGAISPSEG